MAYRWLVAAMLAALSFAAVAVAQTYPERRVTLVIPYPPGATTDILGRMVATALQEKLGGTFIVENKGGASTAIGASYVANSPPDGYTLLMATGTTLAVNPGLYKNLPYSNASFDPITLAAAFPFVLIVDPALGVNSVKELIALAKRKSLSFASVGVGTPHHLDAELFMTMTGITARHAIYKGSVQGMSDIAAGEVSFMFTDPAPILGYLKEGKVKALAVTSRERFKPLPDVPTLVEAGVPDYEAISWMGFVTRAGTPRPVIDRLHDAIVAYEKQPEVEDRLLKLAILPKTSTPEEFRRFIAAEAEKWGNVVREANVKVE